MKLLILVQACQDAPYDNINKCQMDTWDSIHINDVETWYYYGNNGSSDYIIEGNKIFCPCSEAYNMMHWRMSLALKFLINRDWDYIFRTNTSTYVRKDRIKGYIDKMGLKERIYEGVPGGGFISGTGILMSRDIVNILLEQLDPYPTDSEDACIGSILSKNGIAETDSKLKRLNYNFKENSIHQADYYRCKSEVVINGQIDRSYDIVAMRDLFNTFTKQNK